MGIMPDSWIKKMAIERKMIDPFVENQVKKMFYLTVCLLMDMMQEYPVVLRFLQM